MTNAEIIKMQTALLGIDETVHTYAAWKSIGYQVKKGSKALFKTKIWKHTSKKNDNGEDESKMFMTNAAFFGMSQVEKIA